VHELITLPPSEFEQELKQEEEAKEIAKKNTLDISANSQAPPYLNETIINDLGIKEEQLIENSSHDSE
jgi:hypothetical protein